MTRGLETRRLTAATLSSRATRAVTRVALGLGIVALVLSERHTGISYRSVWGIVGWVGFALVVLSLPLQIYHVYLHYRRSRRREMRADVRPLPNGSGDRNE
jgi:hypothetical protein